MRRTPLTCSLFFVAAIFLFFSSSSHAYASCANPEYTVMGDPTGGCNDPVGNDLAVPQTPTTQTPPATRTAQPPTTPSNNTLVTPSPYDCPSGQTYSSQGGSSGAGGCVSQPTTGAPITPKASSDSANPQTYNPPPGSGVVSNGNLKYVPLEPIPGLENLTGNLEFNQLLAGIFRILILFGGIIAVGAFVYAGVVYMVSEAIGTKVYAKQRIKAAFLGLLLLIGCWLILQTINPQLLIFNNGLNPVPINYQIVGPAADTRSADQAAIDRVNTLRGTADQADIDRAMAAEERAKAACLQQNGEILPPNWLSTHPTGCRGGGYSSCNLITGVDLYSCGVK